MDDAALPKGLLAGERRVVARALSLMEAGAPAAKVLSAAIAAHLGRAHVVGITGSPGAGKSTLIHALLGELVERGKKVGVVAVDPSSPITRGAVLGDRVRMGKHGSHENVFIRSVASRGHLGGLSKTTAELVDVFDAAGFDVVIVETVGAGQSEVEIMRVADTRVVVSAPGLGDGVQAIKAGILEIADILVVTKSDLPGADATLRDLKDMLHLRAADLTGKLPVAVLSTTATTGDGVGRLLDQIERHGEAAGRGLRLAKHKPAAAILDSAAQVKALALRDPYMRFMGIRCISAGSGEATVSLNIRDEHLNFNGGCHGGVIFSLADAAFGLASNSHEQIASGIDAHATFQFGAKGGDVLIAHAREVSRSRKLGFYEVEVRREDGKVISTFTGTVYISSNTHPPITSQAKGPP